MRNTAPSRWVMRKAIDNGSKVIISFGGIAVIFSIILIGVFLFYMVAPLFAPADIKLHKQYTLDTSTPVLYLASDDYLDTAYAFTANGVVHFFDATNGKHIQKPTHFIDVQKNTPQHQKTVFSHSVVLRNKHSHAFGLDNGEFILRHIHFGFSFKENIRNITPEIHAPLGKLPIQTGLPQTPITKLAVHLDDSTLLALVWQEKQLHFLQYTIKNNLLTDEKTLTQTASIALAGIQNKPLWMGIDQLAQWAYVLTEDTLYGYAISTQQPALTQTLSFPQHFDNATTAQFLLGNISIIVGFTNGKLVQIFPVRNAQGNENLRIIREFPALDGAIVSIAPEYIRRGFAAISDTGNGAIYYSTNAAEVGKIPLQNGVDFIEMSPRHNALLAKNGKNIRIFDVKNTHPEISVQSLFSTIWYEFYPRPDYIWQSSSASNDFEPKFSLTPLTFGTLKAAFYALLLATPLAIMGAIYTAFFLSPKLRQIIKPCIELMEAVPTVILGFIAGLWLAPFVEKNLLFLFTLTLVIFPVTIIFGYIIYILQNKAKKIPKTLKILFSEEWRILLVIPLILLLTVTTLLVQHPLETIFFHGSMRNYLSNDLGIAFDQRNAIVIGIAMGFAVIPTIFSITEDAVFSVPKQLISGSLALGASKWQTLTGVVLPTASPGIFSAVMIGMGRAVGETMIVIMATGNTPIIDWNIFEGMRTLSANIAVEMPESEVGSSHYRILFLAGLLLFLFTFVVNTVAEIVRQNLRKRYGSI